MAIPPYGTSPAGLCFSSLSMPLGINDALLVDQGVFPVEKIASHGIID